MKNIFLAYSTARWYWTHSAKGAKTIAHQPKRRILAHPTSGPKDARALIDRTLFARALSSIDVMTTERGYRSAADIRIHYSNNELPPKSFVQLADHIFIACPELSFVQAARELSFGQLVHYGGALCGNYAVDKTSEFGVVERPALTTVNRLKSYLDAADRIAGAKPARQALPYILENSRSPRESSAGLLASLPYSKGGKALLKLQLNKRIDIPPHLQHLTDRSFFVADFYWPGKAIAAEYDSDVAHSGNEARLTDAIKRNVLPAMGFTPFSFTQLQVDRSWEMDKACENLRVLLGIRTREKVPADYEKRKARLRFELLANSDTIYQIPCAPEPTPDAP